VIGTVIDIPGGNRGRRASKIATKALASAERALSSAVIRSSWLARFMRNSHRPGSFKCPRPDEFGQVMPWRHPTPWQTAPVFRERSAAAGIVQACANGQTGH
jgi:hypothetical protein